MGSDTKMGKHQKLSIFISLVLRHKPEVVGLKLDDQGYLHVNELLKGVNNSGRHIDIDMLNEIVDTDDKGRYSFNADKTKVRANQGHSIPVNLNLVRGKPKDKLYHGTALEYKDNIDNKGLLKGERQYVHLSDDINTAIKVGSRHGEPIVYLVDHEKLLLDGYELWVSENNVWLSNDIPAKYLSIVNEK